MTKNTARKHTLSTCYLLHCIEGINITVLGDSLINTYITKNHLKYELYIEMKKKSALLDIHPQFINSFIMSNSIIYTMSIPDKYKKDYRYFRNNEVDKFSNNFKDRILELSGYHYKHEINAELAFILPEKRGLLCKYMLIDFYNWGTYENLLDIPFVKPVTIGDWYIDNWEDFALLVDKVDEIFANNTRAERLNLFNSFIDSSHNFAEVLPNEFIENHGEQERRIYELLNC